jgi:hypothetical protein
MCLSTIVDIIHAGHSHALLTRSGMEETKILQALQCLCGYILRILEGVAEKTATAAHTHLDLEFVRILPVVVPRHDAGFTLQVGVTRLRARVQRSCNTFVHVQKNSHAHACRLIMYARHS